MPVSEPFVRSHPSVEHLRASARRRIPRFAFDYLEGGCHSEINLARNTRELRELQLMPEYLGAFEGANLETELWGHRYSAPFGVAPIGLQGLMWPGSTEMLARAAHQAGIPFILSTVATADIETVSELTEGKAWFQLYHPTEDELRDRLLGRLEAAGISVLVLLADTPTFGYRAKEIKNGLSIPPRMSVGNVMQMMASPSWVLGQLRAGLPTFATLKPYLPKGQSLKHLGEFMNRTFSGRLTTTRLSGLRDRWKGRLVVKGLVNEDDVDKALAIGIDGFIVSNHGGRQHDIGPSTVRSLLSLAPRYGHRTTIMMDSGVRTGADIAAALAGGARLAFLGRSFMYGVGALGSAGGPHVIAMLQRQLRQVMEQVGCERPHDLPQRLMTKI